MDVEERRRTVGILRSLGLTARDVVLTFLCYGLTVGVLGVLLGMAGGLLLSLVINLSPILHFEGPLATVYGVNSIPVAIQPLHALGVGLYAAVIVLLASLIPALRTRRIPVLTAIRYE